MVTACSGTGGVQIIDLTNVATGGGVPLLPGIGYSWPGLQTVHPGDQLERQVHTSAASRAAARARSAPSRTTRTSR